MRVLASIREIKDLQNIDGADFIELAIIDGWQAVVKKGEFKVGDTCVYIEIDAILPPVEPFKFMEARKYRVRTIKLRGCLSQGVALPLSYFAHIPGMKQRVGDDVTALLGITKYDPQDHGDIKVTPKHNSFVKLLLRYRVGRWVYHKVLPRPNGAWPEYIPKTDEDRIQNIRDLDVKLKGHALYATEKLDGQSFTAFYKGRTFLHFFIKGVYGVCSRNVWFKSHQRTNNTWCNLARTLHLEEILKGHYATHKVCIAIQGEVIGSSIQGNKYGVKENSLHVYNVYNIDKGRYFTLTEKLRFIAENGLTHVPMVELTECHNTVSGFLQAAEGKSALNGCEREGIVVRSATDDSVSFKAISNRFLLKEK